MFSGLRGASMTRRWFARVGERIVKPICRELRLAQRLPGFEQVPLTQTEVELVWGMNSRIFYFGVRKYIYGMPVPRNLEQLIAAEVRTFFDGVGRTLEELIAPPRRQRSAAKVAGQRKRKRASPAGARSGRPRGVRLNGAGFGK